MREKSSIVPTLALAFAMLLWASSFVALKYAFVSYDPMVVVFSRMFIALAFVLIFFNKVFSGLSFSRSDAKYLFVMALFEPCLYFIFEAEALINTTASQAGVVTSLMPIMVGIGAWAWLGEKITKNVIIGALMAMAGVIWLSLSAQSSSSAPNPIYGNFMEFLAMVMAMGYALTLKKLSSKFGPLFLTSFQVLVGSIFFAILLLFKGTRIPTEFPLIPTLTVAYLGVVVSFGAYGLYNYGVSKMEVSKASLFINLIPVLSVALGYLILDEVLGLSQILGAVVILMGVYISQTTRWKL